MRFIITAQSSTEKETTEQQLGFDVELFKAYMRFNEEMHQAGVACSLRGSQPLSARSPRRGSQWQALRCGRPLRRVEGIGRRLLPRGRELA